ncbi:MAG: L,D-transpeptidase [Longimicrobiales bacterium]
MPLDRPTFNQTGTRAARTVLRCAALLLFASGFAGCSTIRSVVPWGSDPRPGPATESDYPAQPSPMEIARERERARAVLPRTPRAVGPSTTASARIRRAALADRRLRLAVSTAGRVLWLMRDSTVLFVAPVAVGMHERFTWEGVTYNFTTPHSQRRVLSKGERPIWVPPDWHYFERAAADGLRAVQLKKGQIFKLADGTRIEMRGDVVGRVNQLGNFWPFTPGSEIILEGKIFIPPVGSEQRQVREVLGTHKLEIGDGYLIHGTNEETSIGEAVSHGCVRMYNEDVAQLYVVVPVGTPVYIF